MWLAAAAAAAACTRTRTRPRPSTAARRLLPKRPMLLLAVVAAQVRVFVQRQRPMHHPQVRVRRHLTEPLE
jgi:hypothetical protein